MKKQTSKKSLETKKAGAVTVQMLAAPAGNYERTQTNSRKFLKAKNAFFDKMIKTGLELSEDLDEIDKKDFNKSWLNSLGFLEKPSFRRFLKNLGVLDDSGEVDQKCLKTVCRVLGFIEKTLKNEKPILYAGPLMVDYRAIRSSFWESGK